MVIIENKQLILGALEVVNRQTSVQGRTEKLKRGGGRMLIKTKSFCEILNKMSKRGGAKERRPLPLYAYE